MNFVDEEHVARLEIGELGRKVAGFGDDGSRRRAKVHAEFARDDLRERRLAETRGTDEQHVIERIAASLRRFNKDFEILCAPPPAR